MLPVHEFREVGSRAHHAVRLRGLLQRFRVQEITMTATLQDLQGELERWHREAAFVRVAGGSPAATVLERCAGLQAECDQLAIELVHVRLAISGVAEELAEHESRTAYGAAVDGSLAVLGAGA
jgi:hypothetical protein